MTNRAATEDQELLIKEYHELKKSSSRIDVRLGEIEEQLEEFLKETGDIEIVTTYGQVRFKSPDSKGGFDSDRFRELVLNCEKLTVTIENETYIKPDLLDLVQSKGGDSAWRRYVDESQFYKNYNKTVPRKVAVKTWDPN